MNQVYTKHFLETPFTITCSSVDNGPGVWNSTKVSIYRDKTLIGEYIRNYSSHGPATFYPFKQGDDWYALYSANYTATRVMKLHDDRIEDWCGEQSNAHGFCPVEFYIPRYVTSKYTYKHGDEIREDESFTVDCDVKDMEFIEEFRGTDAKNDYCSFAFLCGCVWGDDSSWKIKYIDLSNIKNKILSITDKFGYWEMPSTLTLKECISMDNWEPDHDWISLTRVERINLKTNERG